MTVSGENTALYPDVPNDLSFLQMTFTNFSLEVGENCQNDHVMIKNGGNWDSPSISGEYGWCDTNPPSMGPIVSSSHQAIVIFDTDGYINSQGFRLEWTTETQGTRHIQRLSMPR